MRFQGRAHFRYSLIFLLALTLGVSVALLRPVKTPPPAVAHVTPAVEPAKVELSYDPPPRAPRPKPVFSVPARPSPAVRVTPSFIETEDGRYEAVTERYHATLSAENGLSYRPLRENESGAGRELRVALSSVTHGSDVLFDREQETDANSEIAVTEAEGGLSFWRAPGFEEHFVPRGDGVEQTFVLEKPLAGKGSLDFVCELALRNLTPLPPRANRNGGILFVDEAGQFAARYGQIVVHDSEKRGLSLEPQLSADGKSLSFSVPDEWLRTARFPLVIDPLVGADFLVSLDNPVGVSPPIVIPGNTSFLVVWNDYRAGTSLPQLFATIVSQSGIVSSDFPISSAVGLPRDFRLQRIQGAFDGSNWLVVWSDDRQVGPGIRCSIISTLGEILGGNDFLIAPTSGVVSEDPLVVFNGIDYIIGWQSTPPGASGGSQVYFTRLTTAGVVDTPNVVPVEVSPINQSLLFMSAQEPSGDTLLVYKDSNEIPAQTRSVRIAVDASIRDPGGTALFTEDAAAGGFGKPIGVAFVNTEWNILSSQNQTVDSSIYLHKISTAGVVTPPVGVFAEMGLGPTGSSLDQYAPAFAGSGEWLFMRNEKVNSTVFHQIGKRVTFAGVDQDPVPFQIDTATQGILRNGVAAQSGSVFLTVWLDGRRSVAQPADAKNIIAALVDATLAGSSGTALLASVAASPLTGEAPLTVSFDSAASSTGYDTLSWDFGDGTTATTPAASHTYKTNGTYTAQLKLTKGAYIVFDTAIIIVGGGGPVGTGATQVGVPPENSPGMVTDLFLGGVNIKLNFSQTGADIAHVSGIVDTGALPDNLTGLLGSVSIGAASTAFNLDAKGDFKTDTSHFLLNPRNGNFVFDILTGDLRAACDTLGARNETNTKSITVNIPVTVTLGKFSTTATVGAVYQSTVDISGVANFGFLGTGTEVSGSFLIGKCVVSEDVQKATNKKVHSFSIKGQVKKPNAGIYRRAPSGQFVITVGSFSVPVPVGQFQDSGGQLKFVARAGVYGLKKFSLDLNSGTFNLQMLKVPAEGAGGDGLPLSKSGQNVTKADLNISFQFDLVEGPFAAGRYIHIERKDASAKNWKQQ